MPIQGGPNSMKTRQTWTRLWSGRNRCGNGWRESLSSATCFFFVFCFAGEGSGVVGGHLLELDVRLHRRADLRGRQGRPDGRRRLLVLRRHLLRRHPLLFLLRPRNGRQDAPADPGASSLFLSRLPSLFAMPRGGKETNFLFFCSQTNLKFAGASSSIFRSFLYLVRLVELEP